jgi:hypothetical protein
MGQTHEKVLYNSIPRASPAGFARATQGILLFILATRPNCGQAKK